MSTSIDAENRVIIVMCGIISVVGTFNGNARNVGKRTVMVGMARIMFKWLGLRSNCKSLVLNIWVNIAKKVVHSMVMLVRLSMSMVVPYNWVVKGQNSCAFPVRKSPNNEC